MSNLSTEAGFLTLADISGYNAFLAGTEFDHAQEIIAELLEFLVERLKPLLTLVQIEGDAVFAYMPETKIGRGETLFELIENTYAAFKNRLASINRHRTCTCAACQNVNTLDLKFFTHYGNYIEFNLDDHHGLMGYAPMIVRKRDWKEPVAEMVGWQGYALFTQEALTKLGLNLEDLQAVQPASGSNITYGLNLKARYEELLEIRQISVAPELADASLRVELDATPPVAWEWLNDPQKRNLWWESFTRWTTRLRPKGRTGKGAVNHCDHGIGEMVETILDWRPFDYYTVEMRITPGGFVVMQTTCLDSLAKGKTEVRVYYRLQTQGSRWLAGPVCGIVAGFLGLEMRRLKKLLAA
jgi:hypothetical protein